MTEYKKGNVRNALTTLFCRLEESPNPLCAEWLYEYDNIRGDDDILTTYRDKTMDKTLESLQKMVNLMNAYKQINNMREKHSNELTNTISGL